MLLETMLDTDVFLALNFDPAIKKVKNFDSMNEKTLRVTIHIKKLRVVSFAYVYRTLRTRAVRV